MLGLSVYDSLSAVAGNLAAVCFFLVNIPQILMNYKRQSTEGFSSMSVIIRCFGISFHVFNGYMHNIAFPLLFAGVLLFLENLIFIIQIGIYNQAYLYLLCLMIPIPIYCIATMRPESWVYTRWVNPCTQILCYVPYVLTLVKAGTTKGISMLGQHLNFIGGICGLLMCSVGTRCDPLGWCFYLISLMQATVVFCVAIKFEEFRIFDQTKAPKEDEMELNETEIEHEEELVEDLESIQLDSNLDEEEESDNVNKL